MQITPEIAGEQLVMSIDALKGFMAERKQSMWLIAANFRPGAAIFSSYVEYTMYPPGTDENESFELLELPWQRVLWCVIGVPIRDMLELRGIADYCGLKFTDGVPMIMEMTKGEVITQHFPMNSRRCFTLENTEASGVHRLSPRHLAHISEVERNLCSKIWNHDWRPHPRRIREALLAAVHDKRFADSRL